MSPRRRTPDPWPWPADTPLERARRIARAYRDALAEHQPEHCRRLDTVARQLGQGWIVPKPLLYDDHDMLTTDQLADAFDVQPRTVDTWRNRGLTPVDTVDGPRYVWRDVLDYHAARRQRRTRTQR